ncbi:hypothetical protein H4R33_003645, partial [Dimargaris cristalligena]
IVLVATLTMTQAAPTVSSTAAATTAPSGIVGGADVAAAQPAWLLPDFGSGWY